MIAILALQGAFAEHQQMLSRIGITSALIRNLDDWRQYVLRSADYAECGLIIPGGESTTMMRIMHDEGLTAPISEAIKSGMPVFGTCAGLILLDKQHLDTMSMTALRNAYGRQLGSFRTEAEFKGIGIVPMTFIRAPYIDSISDDCEMLATVDNRIVAARQGNQLVTAFHPELDDDTSIHRFFISMAEEYARGLS